MIVEFVCTAPGTSSVKDATPYFKMPQPNSQDNSKPRNPSINPAWITAISHVGLVEINFYEALFVPNFTITLGNRTRRLESANLTLNQLINPYVLDVTLRTAS